MQQTYEKLHRLPLFTGMCQDEVTDIVGFAKLGFHKVISGQDIVREHDACRQLLFLQAGTMSVTKHSDCGDYVIGELLEAPVLIEPERLFGLHQHFSHSYKAATDCHLMTIEKSDVLAICQGYNIFFLNLLSQLSTTVQRAESRPWHQQADTIGRKIVRFLQEHFLSLRGQKTICITMQTLADHIHEPRLQVSKTLNQWNVEGLIQLTKGKIHINAFERLL